MNSNTNANTVNYSLQAILSLTKIIHLFLKNKFFILKVLSAVSILSIIILLYIPDRYTAESSFIPPSPDIVSDYGTTDFDTLLMGGPSMGIKAPSFGGFKEPNKFYLELLRSRTINEPIINKFNLIKYFKKDYIDETIKVLDDVVDIRENFGIIEISVTLKDPELAAEIANEYINQLSLVMNNLNTVNIKSELAFIQNRLNGINATLNILSGNVIEFQEKNKVIDVEAQGELLMKSSADIESQIIVSEADLSALKQTFTGNSEKVKALESKINSLKNVLKKIKGKNMSMSDPKGNTSDIDLSILDIPLISKNYLSITRNYKLLENIYTLLMREYEISKLKEAVKSLNIKILDRAVKPDKKSYPKRLLLLIMIIFITVLLLISYILLKYSIEKISEQDPEGYQNFEKIKENILKELSLKQKS